MHQIYEYGTSLKVFTIKTNILNDFSQSYIVIDYVHFIVLYIATVYLCHTLRLKYLRSTF